MKISLNNNVKLQTNFKAQYKNIGDFEDFSKEIEQDTNTCGYDDKISQERRALIRESILAQNMRYYDYHSQAHKNTETVVNVIAKEQGYDINAHKKKANTDSESLKDIWHCYPVELSQQNEYRGAKPKSEQLNLLKKAGIERVISLNSPTYGIKESGFTKECNEAGLEHLKLFIPHKEGNFPARSREELISKINMSCKSDSEKKMEIEETDKEIRHFVDNMIQVVEGMRKSYYYIHCDNGTTKTNNGIFMLMAVSDLKICSECEESRFVEKMIENVEKVLTDEDKARLNYGANF